MTGLYQCSNCKKFYALSNGFEKRTEDTLKKKSIYAELVVCECGTGHIVGGELDFYPEMGEVINMFGFSPKQYGNCESLYETDAMMLIETDRDDTSFSTYHKGRVINFEPKNK